MAGFVQTKGGHPAFGQRPGQHQPMHHQPMHPMQAPAPPREALPLELRVNRPLVDISDIRQDFLTDAEMRARCIEYCPYRFEKALDSGRYDDDDGEDERVPSSWERAIRTRVQGMSKKDIVKEIRRLDSTTHDVVQKKSTLSPALLRQLDIAMDQLSKSEHDPANFVWTLAQIDHQLKEVDTGTAMQRNRIPLGQKVPRPKTHRSSSKRRSSSSLPAGSKKKFWERLSLTAYFKRSPRPHVNIALMYQWNRRAQLMTQPGGPSNAAGMQPGPGGPQAGPPGGGPQAGPPGGGPQRGGPPQMNGGGRGGGGGGGGGGPGPHQAGRGSGPPPPPIRAVPLKAKPPKVLRSDGSDTVLGPVTVQPQPLLVHHIRTNEDVIVQEVGVVVVVAVAVARESLVGLTESNPPVLPGDLKRISDNAFDAGRAAGRNERRPSPPSPAAIIATSGSDIDRIREDAYRTGVHDARRREERFAEEFEVERPRPRRVARVIQHRPNIVRCVSRERVRDLRRIDHLDDSSASFDRLSLDNHDWEYHDRRPRRFDTRYEPEYDFESQFDSFEDDDDFVRPVEVRERPHLESRRRTEYVRQREVPYTMSSDYNASTNPFHPQPRFSMRRRSFERRHL
ncbi:hypothetical protein AB5N19_11624 [Seiridium cardinale]|uniref:Uncharacterized protein n=1 Tax=Seiridium cardinale TaxID=138064 RepID=A0ABR2XVQ0_9PEZI